MTNFYKNSVRWAFDFVAWQPTESQILKAFSFIQLEEKERIGRFVFKCHAKASLIGRLMIRKFLTENSNIAYNKIMLKRDNNGKPFVENEEIKNKVKFSVSHHGNFVVFVGHTSFNEIGVDVMQVTYQSGKNLPNFFRLMSRHFGPNEWRTIKETSSISTMQMYLFNRHWALKESYLKAIGTGITVELNKIEFQVKTINVMSNDYVVDTELYINNVKQNNWSFQETILNPDHIVVIAIQNNKNFDKKPFQFLEFDDIIINAVPLLEEDLKFSQEFMEKEENASECVD